MERIIFVLLAFLLTFSPSVYADSHLEENKKQQCIKLQNIDSTPVIDNKTILVKMKGKTFKRIDILNRCPSLKIQGGFSYSTSINKLCVQDPLRVLYTGSVCMIEKIVDISEIQAEQLLAQK